MNNKVKGPIFKINGHIYPAPSNLTGVTATMVDASRNANGVMVGQKVGRDQYKLDNLQWNLLPVETWKDILHEFKDFFALVTFFAPDTASWKTLKMYPGDRTQEYVKAEMYYNADGTPTHWQNCKVNIIDVGEVE